MRHTIGRMLLLVLGLCCLASRRAAAQSDSSVVRLLNIAERHFDDNESSAADSLARVVLGLPGITRAQRLKALQLAAASRYREGEKEQYADSALGALRDFVRLAPTVPVSRKWTWRGLDSLLTEARRTTFGASASAPESTVVEGVRGRVAIEVVASRPSTFVLRIGRQGESGPGEVVDSLAGADRGTLRFSPVDTDTPRFPTGRYIVTVIAIDPSTSEQIRDTFLGIFTLPNVAIEHVSTVVDPAILLAERSKPLRARSVATGATIAAFVMASVSVSRPPALKNGHVATDSRAPIWGLGLGALATGLSWYLDQGRIILPNVENNKMIRDRFEVTRQATLLGNTKARLAYRGSVVLLPEDR